jgi:hypothetical protein
MPDRWVTNAARRALARRFDLPDDPISRGWAWEVAEPLGSANSQARSFVSDQSVG